MPSVDITCPAGGDARPLPPLAPLSPTPMSTLATALADLARIARSPTASPDSDSASDASSLAEGSPTAPAAHCPAHHPSPGSPRSPPTRRLHLTPPSTPRPNEHLAVLLPKNLWKVCLLSKCPYLSRSHPSQPDALASTCDNFFCRVPFSLLERRHVRIQIGNRCSSRDSHRT